MAEIQYTHLIFRASGLSNACVPHERYSYDASCIVMMYVAACSISEVLVRAYKFTGKERDSETGLDYFGARFYGSNMGRWLSPDEFAGGPVDVFGGDPTPPGPLPYADITNPQSLNKYAYAFNNPLRYVDPDGHFSWAVHTWLTQTAAQSRGYSASTIKLMVQSNLRVDRPSNFFNNHEHGISNITETRQHGIGEIMKVLENREKDAVQSAVKGDYKQAIEAIGAGEHTAQDFAAHQADQLWQHPSEVVNDNDPAKVSQGEISSGVFLQRVENAIIKQVGQEKGAEIIQHLKSAGDEQKKEDKKE